MDSLQKFILVSFTLFVSLTGLGFCYTIVRGPANATVLAGSEARFNCTVSQEWKIIIWLSNGKLVLTVVNHLGPVITENRFTSQNYTAGNEFTSELIIHDVRQSDSGKIECSSQGSTENGYAFLTVQVNGSLFIKDSNLTVEVNKTIEIFCEALGWAPAPNITWKINNSFVDKSMYITEHGQESNGLHNTTSILTLTPLTNETLTCLADIGTLSKPQNATVTLILVESPLENTGDGTSTWIIIVAVVFSVVGFLLLVIIIVIIVYCCHRQKKKESTYQKEMRKVTAKKKDDGSLETRRNGNENNGYIPEESWHPEQMPKVASLPPMASNFYGPEDLEVSSTSQISTQVPRQSSLLSRRSPSLLYCTSIPPVQHFNHHRQQPKNQLLKNNQFRVSHPKPKVLYHRSLQPRSYHPYARVLFSHKQQPQSQHPLIRAPHPRTEQSRGQYPQTKTQPPRGQCSQRRFQQLRGQHIRSQQLQPRIQQVRSQHPQIRKQRPRVENSQVWIQKPKDSDL
ncbi:PREDICTED: immunoglobulin superfamily member 5 isoform X1 [Gavialis gangeticus]|uniref:immunoglobulin superfamily member 5 isoform X1 n=1 Tax=Gavialis gangeticus TaxID=94835 RepID=UPI00092E984E|nr:PREDICTED: immunoglobulin superfamily member 5 isoform X1 [Gavialis gangeticus]